MKYVVRVCACVAVIMGAWLLHPSSAHAAEGFNVITSPLPIKISTAPGKTVKTELRIKNQGDNPEGIKVGLMKFGATGTSGTPDIYDLGAKDTYGSWVHFAPQQFTAQPGVWNSITMTINVPSDAALGYYLAVTYSPAHQPGVPDTTTLKGSVATLILLEVKTSNEKRDLQLVSFTASHTLYEYLPATFNVKLRNDGNIFISPSGNIFINRGQSQIGTLDLNDAGGSVLPGTYRVFNVPWKDGFPRYQERLVNGKPIPDSHDVPKQSLHWDFTQVNKFRFGKYSAKLLVVYDNGTNDVPMEASVSFWVLPWKIMLVLLVILALVGFGVYTVARSAFGKARSGVGKIKRRGKHEKKE